MSWKWRIPEGTTVAESSVLLVLVAGGAFSYYQVGSGMFSCGRELAGPEIRYWLAACALQAVLYMAAGLDRRVSTLYRITQYALLPLVGLVMAQLAFAFPHIFVWAAIVTIVYWFGRHLLALAGRPLAVPDGIGAAIAETVLVLLATAVIHTALAFIFLHLPGMVMGRGLFFSIMAVALALAAFIVRRQAPSGRLSIAAVPPLALLMMVLLRAKFPDGAFDSLFYKATLPMAIAEWGTALTGVFDHTLLGTNFSEILVANLRILDPTYSPAMTSTLAFLAMWAVAPLAMSSAFGALGPASALAIRAAVLLTVSLSEPLLAAGTAYHEPLMGLLMAGALLPMSVGWLFLAAAISTKLTVLFIAPVLLMVKLMASPRTAAGFDPWASGPWRERFRAGRRQLLDGLVGPQRATPLVAALCLGLAVLVIGEQLARNLAHTGRILGVTETLAGLTDPEGRVLARPPAAEAASASTALDRYGKTFVHILTLDRWIVPNESGFHIIPSSRANAVAAVLAVCFAAFATLRRRRSVLALLLVWCGCAFVLLNFVTQGRHLYVLSFGAAVAIAAAVGRLAADAMSRGASALPMLLAIATAITAFGDQLVGSLINNGWECRRILVHSVVRSVYEGPHNPLEQRLAQVVAEYRATSPGRSGVAPSIVCENGTDRKSYVGAHHIFAYMSAELTQRYLAADPSRAQALPSAMLALCFTSPQFMEFMIPAAVRGEYEEVQGASNVRIMVSKRLMSGAPAQSLLGYHLGKHGDGAAARDLVARWEAGSLPAGSTADTPSGKGAFAMDVGGAKTGVILAPYRLTFDVRFPAGGTVEVEAGMLYSNSDGMALTLEMEGANGARDSRTLTLEPKPEADATPRYRGVRIALAQGLSGPGRIVVVASSPSGNSTADWAVVRRLRIEPAAP